MDSQELAAENQSDQLSLLPPSDHERLPDFPDRKKLLRYLAVDWPSEAHVPQLLITHLHDLNLQLDPHLDPTAQPKGDYQPHDHRVGHR